MDKRPGREEREDIVRRFVKGGVLVFIGYILSPLSWWNDLFVNIPIAYGFAVLVSLISCRFFAPAMIAGYWLTNIIGLIMMHRGVSDAFRPEKAPAGEPERKEGPASHRALVVNLAIATGYTGLIVLLAVLGVLKPPSVLKRECPTDPLHFAREEIEMNVRPGYLEIGGMYHFTNTFKKPTSARIFYPFPLDSTLDYPDSIALPGVDFERGDSGVFFRMPFTPQHEDSFFACYRQPLRGKSARYIVTTTRQWGRPIDVAQFRISVPREFLNVELSYKPDRIERNDSTVVYHFVRRRFYPDRDVIVTWR
jgi:hypothetical protein